METVKGKCLNCGAEIDVQKGATETVCPVCKFKNLTDKAIKYRESFIGKEIGVKKAHGEKYREITDLYGVIEDLLYENDFEKAEEKISEAISIADGEYKPYWYMVAVKTKNFTDLKDEEHKEYLSKAISLADDDQKAEIKKEYKPYYDKCNFTAEEMATYIAENKSAKKELAEKKLKNLIPENMAKEKTAKSLLILTPIIATVGIAVMIISVVFNFDILSIAGAVLVFASYFTFRYWYSNKYPLKAFNAYLDLYDYLDQNPTDNECQIEVYQTIDKICDKFTLKENVALIDEETVKLVRYLIDKEQESLLEYMIEDKYFTQFLEKE